MADSQADVIREWARSRRRVEQVAAELAERITEAKIEPYQSLPKTDELEKEFDISASTVRDIKRLMAARGFLLMELGRYVVAPEAAGKAEKAGGQTR
jgi:DNA-binding FadR family transcriptional regulator